MMKFNESLTQAGVLLALDGLLPPSQGARISLKDGKKTVTDGPFTEAKELVGGYWLIDVKSKEEAVEWATRCPLEGDVDHRGAPGRRAVRLPGGRPGGRAPLAGAARADAGAC